VEQTWGPWDEEWQLARFRESFRPEHTEVIVVSGKDVGVLRLQEEAKLWCLSVLEIAPEWQRKGMGTCILRSILARAAECRLPVDLQVLKVNPAQRLYERIGFRKTGESTTHIQMRAWPTAAARRNPSLVADKVVAYITCSDRLLVFRHTQHPQAGIQVPAGTLECGEEPSAGVLREAAEETGLGGLQIVQHLGTAEHTVFGPGCCQRQLRHFFHLQAFGEHAAPWRHWEMSASDGSGPVEFELFWAPMGDRLPELSGSLGAMLPLLLRQLGHSVSDVS
jgi:ADP-ribose pyrophosphatase YjhB (NUDIX family)